MTMIHAQFTRKDQLDKFVAYKIRPSFYTLHTYYFAEAHIANRGGRPGRLHQPDARRHRRGPAAPTNHTDFYVAPLDQLFMLWSAVNRISRAGAEIGPDQRCSPLEGLKTMTIYVADQYGEQDSKGSIAPGKLADLVILDADPLSVEPMAIKDIAVVGIKEGGTIFGPATRERRLPQVSTIAGVGTRLSAWWKSSGSVLTWETAELISRDGAAGRRDDGLRGVAGK